MAEEFIDESLRAVADPTRRAILRLVRDDELPAGEIARHFPRISRPAVSQHLRVLTDAGLVEARPTGTGGSTDGGATDSAMLRRLWRRCGRTASPASSRLPSGRMGGPLSAGTPTNEKENRR